MNIISGVIRVFRLYGRELLLALLLHLLLVAALMQTKLTQPAKPKPTEPIVSYLYQPPLAEVKIIAASKDIAEPEVIVEPKPEPTSAEASLELSTAAKPVVLSMQTRAKPLAVEPEPPQPDVSASTQREIAAQPAPTAIASSSLAQRALQHAAASSPAQMQQAATSSYQQHISAQQRVKLTVEKRHQQLSSDPAKQVIAQLDHGLQLIRTKDGCRIADPTKDGFEALMAAGRAPCGDEVSNKESLKKALEKHIKR